jgi:hypothetical protein
MSGLSRIRKMVAKADKAEELKVQVMTEEYFPEFEEIEDEDPTKHAKRYKQYKADREKFEKARAKEVKAKEGVMAQNPRQKQGAIIEEENMRAFAESILKDSVDGKIIAESLLRHKKNKWVKGKRVREDEDTVNPNPPATKGEALYNLLRTFSISEAGSWSRQSLINRVLRVTGPNEDAILRFVTEYVRQARLNFPLFVEEWSRRPGNEYREEVLLSESFKEELESVLRASVMKRALKKGRELGLEFKSNASITDVVKSIEKYHRDSIAEIQGITTDMAKRDALVEKVEYYKRHKPINQEKLDKYARALEEREEKISKSIESLSPEQIEKIVPHVQGMQEAEPYVKKDLLKKINVFARTEVNPGLPISELISILIEDLIYWINKGVRTKLIVNEGSSADILKQVEEKISEIKSAKEDKKFSVAPKRNEAVGLQTADVLESQERLWLLHKLKKSDKGETLDELREMGKENGFVFKWVDERVGEFVPVPRARPDRPILRVNAVKRERGDNKLLTRQIMRADGGAVRLFAVNYLVSLLNKYGDYDTSYGSKAINNYTVGLVFNSIAQLELGLEELDELRTAVRGFVPPERILSLSITLPNAEQAMSKIESGVRTLVDLYNSGASGIFGPRKKGVEADGVELVNLISSGYYTDDKRSVRVKEEAMDGALPDIEEESDLNKRMMSDIRNAYMAIGNKMREASVKEPGVNPIDQAIENVKKQKAGAITTKTEKKPKNLKERLADSSTKEEDSDDKDSNSDSDEKLKINEDGEVEDEDDSDEDDSDSDDKEKVGKKKEDDDDEKEDGASFGMSSSVSEEKNSNGSAPPCEECAGSSSLRSIIYKNNAPVKVAFCSTECFEKHKWPSSKK